ncbi:winged helix-turn-helix domain-containing protein [Rahnella aceris]|uniref:winged helix-turn-helix domain-containing protein n=1 Tax=Rahnella sp. (strain Y9602) TaxID=2703885 RepID=UPI0019061B06|nr:helix-turn-helix domain-containing protein [Rahnella aceris]QQN35150.1 winged helix-turn-helix domain-containing protein [Rahnella aceris]
MLYTIEGRVLFRTDDGALWVKDREDEKIILTPIVSRLLHLFFQEQGKILTREKILTYIWENYGLEPSNNSLNQYVSKIRKVMVELGLPNDAISTLPRLGFTLSNELVLVAEDVTYTELHDTPDIRTDSFVQKRIVPFRRLAAVIFLAIFIIIPFLIEAITDKVHHQQMVISPVLLGQTGSCTIYSLMMGRNDIHPKMLSLVQHYIKENSITCGKDNVVYFSSSNSMLNLQGGRLLLTTCKKNNDELVSCIDNSYYTWVE